MKPIASVFVLLLMVFASAVACGGGEVAPAAALSSWSGDPLVQTLYGAAKAVDDMNETLVWKAIPFARPPVGPLRWKAPRDPEPWKGVLQNTEFSEQCPQLDITGRSVTGSEDCLYLNIWRPQSTEEGLPVYFWIHGGGNSAGSASEDTYDGANIARTSNLVVVTTNYRLGPLGWFSHPSLHTGDELDDSGNYGTLDIIKALEWVRDNIEAFGGDPENVTIAGESAGAMNVFSLLISPEASGLFHRAIAQSGFPVASAVADGEESAGDVIVKMLVNDGTAADETEAREHLNGMTDSDIEAYLRSKTPAELLAGYDNLAFSMIAFPFIFRDGTVIPEEGFGAFADGTYDNKVPIIIGSNKEETKIFLMLDPALLGRNELYQKVASYSSDLWKAVGVDEVARKLSSVPGQPGVYVYQFLWGAPDESGQSVIPSPWGARIGASHGLDVPFFFGNDEAFSILSSFIFTRENAPGREALSSAMMAYVAEFARTGSPDKPEGNLTEWEPWTNAPGEFKCLLLDASKIETRIRMSSAELTLSGVKESAPPEVLDVLDELNFPLDFVENYWGLEVTGPSPSPTTQNSKS